MKPLLFSLIALTAITSLTGGVQMMNSPGGEVLNLQLSLLEQTPFKDFLIPGIILAVLVGGINLIALIFQIQLHPARFKWAMAAGTVLSLWIILQMFLLQQVHLLHFIYLCTSLLIIFIAYKLMEAKKSISNWR